MDITEDTMYICISNFQIKIFKIKIQCNIAKDSFKVSKSFIIKVQTIIKN